MGLVDLTEANKNITKIDALEISEVSQIPFELFNKKSNRITKLVANAVNQESMTGSNRWFQYEFTEPVFLCRIAIVTQNYGIIDNFEIEFETVEGNRESTFISSDDNFYYFDINNFVKSIRFKPPKKYFSQPEIIKVSLQGFIANELEYYLKIISSLESFKSEIIKDSQEAIKLAEKANIDFTDKERKYSEIKVKISDERKTFEELIAQNGMLKAEISGTERQREAANNSIITLSKEKNTLEEGIENRQTINSSLSKDIVKSKLELSSLQDDINMFPTEISGFVSQAAQTTKHYWVCAAAPILLLVIITILLLFKAANLTTIMDENDNVRIFSIIATRMPYVLIATAIVGAAYKLAYFLIKEIIRINQQRLNLSKISIIAADVSNASVEGLTKMTDIQKIEFRTKLKMEMLRDHMKDYLSKDFSASTIVPPKSLPK